MKYLNKYLIFALFFGMLFLVGGRVFAYTNLLTNPGAETGTMTGWTIDSNGGDGWKTDWNGPGHSDARVFSTSYDWDIRHQTIDLVAAGYTTGQLDSGTFDAKMSEWIYTRGDQGGQYFLRFELLAGDGTTVLASYDRGTQGAPITLPAGTAWFQESHTFTNIPSGTRYIKFKDGGKSVAWWAGNYGTNFDDASVVLADTALYELAYTAGANGSLTGTVTQTLSSGSTGSAVTAVPEDTYMFVDWSDDSTANPRTDTGVSGNISVTANFALAPIPVISHIVSYPSARTARIRWGTDQLASSRVEYGLTSNYGETTVEADISPRTQSHEVDLSGLTACTVYHYKVVSTDAYTNEVFGNDLTFATTCEESVPLWVFGIVHTPDAGIAVQDPAMPITPAVGFLFTKNLKRGQKGEEVKKLQTLLRDQGTDMYPEGLVSGNFGVATEKAVIRFQEKYAGEILAPAKQKKGTGVVGSYTRAKLNALLGN